MVLYVVYGCSNIGPECYESFADSQKFGLSRHGRKSANLLYRLVNYSGKDSNLLFKSNLVVVWRSGPLKLYHLAIYEKIEQLKQYFCFQKDLDGKIPHMPKDN